MSKPAAFLMVLLPAAMVGVVLFLVLRDRPAGSVKGEFATPTEIKKLENRIEDLETQLAALRRGGGSLPTGGSLRGKPTVDDAPVATSEREAMLEARLNRIEQAIDQVIIPEELESLVFAGGPGPKNRIKEILEEVREEEREEQRKQRREREEERTRARIEALAEKLNLSAFQVDEMTRILLEANAARSGLFSSGMGRGMFDGMGGGDFREKMVALGTERDNQLKEVLSPWQYEEYKKSESERRGPRGMFGGGRRGGSSNRGGGGGDRDG